MTKIRAYHLLFLILYFYFPFMLKAEQNIHCETQPMFAVIYRGYVKPELESQYQEYWKIVASYFVKERGALGSTLHQAEDGMWVAYSRWPDKATRDASWPRDKEKANADLPLHIQQAIEGLKACGEQLPEICMEVREVVHPIGK